jgi:hypothetical protein
MVLVACLAAVPLCAQNFPAKGDDTVGSFGAFWILIEPAYQPMFAGCPAYNATTHVLTSGNLYEPVTVIGRSASIKENSPGDNNGVPVGSANVMVKDAGMVTPAGFTPIAANSNEVHTEMHRLMLATWPPVPPANQARVRAGVCYNSTTCSSPPPPNRISRGEVVSNNATPGAAPDFPARSYFNVFAQIDIPACGGFPGATVFNGKPLIVYTPSIPNFPPTGVVYTHDSSSAVGVKFVANGSKWKKNERLGCVILAGHGVTPVFRIRRIGEVQEAPSAVPVSLQKEKAPEAAQRRPPENEEIEREARKFEEHMKGVHEREGGRHKDCGAPEKDDDDEGNDHGGKGHDKGHEGKGH